MKKILASLVALTMILGLFSGCSQKTEPATPSSTSQGASSSAGATEPAADSTDDLPEVTWRFSHTGVTNHPYHISATALADYVSEKTNGKFTIEVYHSSSLGWETDVLDAMQLGTIEMCWSAIGPYAQYAPAYDAFNLPFVFESADQMRRVFSEMDLSALQAQSEAAGVMDLAYAGFSFRYPINRLHPINEPSDFEGMRFRTMSVPAQVDSYQAFGANVSAVAFAEVYSAMQTGVVDGAENAWSSLENMKFSEVAKYLTELPVVNNLCVLSVSKLTYDKLPAEYQQILREGASLAAEVSNEAQLELDTAALQTMLDNGCELTTPDITPFVEKCQPVVDQYLSQMEPWVQDLVAEFSNYK